MHGVLARILIVSVVESFLSDLLSKLTFRLGGRLVDSLCGRPARCLHPAVFPLRENGKWCVHQKET